ncbi:hypothetical protein CP533_2848 [Ophiocordyceps camponoti-saundersi (nom. inval.)]|nr:hypothetical protein CP533_2848 [Ophiocordyceps camponoti-saundersi (nom. inval.)]
MSKRSADQVALPVSSSKRIHLDDDNNDNDEADVGHDQISSPSSPTSTAEAETPATAVTTPRSKFPSDLKTLSCTWPGCPKTFNRPARLRDHLNSHADHRPFKCTYEGCDKKYVENKHLKQHVKASHTQEAKYLCPRPGCGKSFVTGTRLRRHQAVHEGADRFRCGDCHQSFRKKETLHKHVRQDHLLLPAHECPEPNCDEAFDSKPKLRRHHAKAHGEIRFWCDECVPCAVEDGTLQRVGFTTRLLLDAHVKQEHQNCIFCDYKSATRWELEQHVEVNHSGKSVEDRKLHDCSFDGCGKSFTKISALNVHVRSAHLGVRFVCGEVALSGTRFDGWSNASGCGERFVSKARLEDHVRFIHLGQPRPKLSQIEREVDDADFVLDLCGITNEAKRTIACPRCPERFIRHHDLNLHLSACRKDAEETTLTELMPHADTPPLSVDPLFDHQILAQSGWDDDDDDDDEDEGVFAAQMEYETPADDWAIDEADMLLLTRDPPQDLDPDLFDSASGWGHV